jgi:hypothetical protein
MANAPQTGSGVMSEPPRPWDVVIKVAVDAADEAQARSIVDLVVRPMEITVAGTPPFVQFDDGTWVTEMTVTEPVFEQSEPAGAMDVLSSLRSGLGPVTWRAGTDRPADPDSAQAAQIEWPAGFWMVAGRRETLVHPAVRAMLMQARRVAAWR